MSGQISAAWVAALAETTRGALTQRDLPSALEVVVALAVDTLACDFASVTERRSDGTFRTIAPSAELADRTDALQYELGEGPCVRATHEGGVVLSPTIDEDDRWPAWGPRAAELGVSSVMAVRLSAGPIEMGSLNLYSSQPRTYNENDVELALVIGAHAAIALSHFSQISTLWQAIDSRHLIGQAQGIIMERFDLAPDGSFELLRRLSQQSNTKLRDVAGQIIRTRSLPRPDMKPAVTSRPSGEGLTDAG